ncbi:MAG: ATP-dependent RNA helicase HrpA [Lentisphaerae bacterium]|nr:ATP-dependent RNA helicase HrpA [Lentisphaerota bacterium]
MTPFELRSAAADKLHIGYPEQLPLSSRAKEIKAAWEKSQLIIVGGETGSGKTTQLPKIALELGCGRNGRIGCTQPRRIAAVAMARRLAQELHCSCGKEVGSQVRFEDHTSDETVLKFMTDGILLAELRNDPLFRQYDCLIIDEVHERSLNIDFLLGILRNILPQRPDLKVAISSATLDTGRLKDFFGDVPVISVEGRSYPVEDIFLPPLEDEELPSHVARAVEELAGFDPHGDILVFLPGEREIRECAEMLYGRNYPQTEILMLFSRLSSSEQQRVFHPGRMRRIILSTNVAETSLTIPRIKFCIDSGLARISRYNPRRRIQELQIEMISQASAKQRRGRCGRTADGICIHLYDDEDLQRADAYTDPEIKRTSLAGVILQMAYQHLPDIRNFPFVDPPPGQLIREGLRTLLDIKAVNDAGFITREGKILARLPVDPHLGKMLLEAQKRKVSGAMMILAAGLSIPDVKERPVEKPQSADQAHAAWKDERSDYIAMLKLWDALDSAGAFDSNGNLRKFCKKNFLNFTRVREWKNLTADLAESLHEKFEFNHCETDNYQLIHESLLCGIPRNIAKLDKETRLYRGTDGKKFIIFPGSSLAKVKQLPEWIVCFSLVETSRLFGRNAAIIEPQWVENCVPHLCARTYDQEHFEASSNFVRAREKVMLGSLLIHAGKMVDFAKHNLPAAREIFIREGILTGMVSNCRQLDDFNRIRAELLEYEKRMRRPGALFDEKAAERFFLTNTPPSVASGKALDDFLRQNPNHWKLSRKEFTVPDTPFTPADYPGKLSFAKMSFKLFYTFDPGGKNDGVMLCVPENAINLLPDRALDYPIPGYYADFAEVLLRALPKDIRRQLGAGSIPPLAAEFANILKRDPATRELRPGEAMTDFLLNHTGIEVNPRMFENVDFPEYLKLKLAVLNPQGRLKRIEYDLAGRVSNSSRVSSALPGAAIHRDRGWDSWKKDSGRIPETLELPPGSGRMFYPALTIDNENNLINKELFIRPAEAARHHIRAVCRLFILTNAQFIKLIKRGIRFSNEFKLSILTNAGTNGFEEELLFCAIINSADKELDRVRSPEEFESVSQTIRLNLSGTLDELCGNLEKFAVEYSAIRNFSRRAKEAGKEIDEHLHLLFAPGFLRRRAVPDNYRRYLRALKIRAQRAADAPGKDLSKGEVLEEWQERFYAALKTLNDLTDSDGLYEFWELLEESHIAVYAPEVKSSIKSPVAKLSEFWEKLRI